MHVIGSIKAIGGHGLVSVDVGDGHMPLAMLMNVTGVNLDSLLGDEKEVV